MIPITSARLSATFEENGRAFTCPGEQLTFTCETFHSTTIEIVAEPFICRADPIAYAATDAVGSPGGTDLFQANLTDIQCEPSSPRIANFTTTLIVNSTNETAGTVVECFSLQPFKCDVQRKKLMQSGIIAMLENEYVQFVLRLMG